MDLPSSPTTPLGPMTRARARAIETKVNSLLSELPLSTYETWLLPQAKILCVSGTWREARGQISPTDKTTWTPSSKDKKKSCQKNYSHRTTEARWTSDTWRHQPTSQAPACARSSGRMADSDRTPDTSSARTTGTTITAPKQRKYGDLQTTDADRTSDQSTSVPKHRKSDTYRTTEPPRVTGRPVTVGRLTPAS